MGDARPFVGASPQDLKATEKRIIDRIEKEAAALSFAFHQRFDAIDKRLEAIEKNLKENTR